MGLSSAQVIALRVTRATNDEQKKGVERPTGPASRPYKFLENSELLEEQDDGLLWITETGRAALKYADSGSTPPPRVAP